MRESKEAFSAYAEIESCVFFLGLITKELGKFSERSPISKAIDLATGYGKERSNFLFNSAIEVIERLIENKKIIEADYSKEVAILEYLKEEKK